MIPHAPDRFARDDLARIDAGKYQDERDAVRGLLARMPLDTDDRVTIAQDAADLVRGARAASLRNGVVESFLQEFSLGTREGLALMCLAEALLRTPDDETRDRLIAEKIGSADWASHAGHSDSVFVNASTSLPVSIRPQVEALTNRLSDWPKCDAQSAVPIFSAISRSRVSSSGVRSRASARHISASPSRVPRENSLRKLSTTPLRREAARAPRTRLAASA